MVRIGVCVPLWNQKVAWLVRACPAAPWRARSGLTIRCVTGDGSAQSEGRELVRAGGGSGGALSSVAVQAGHEQVRVTHRDSRVAIAPGRGRGACGTGET